jgi:ribosomal protein L39E
MKTTDKMKNTKDIGIDLFEDYENIPKKVQIILDKYAEKFGDDFGNMDYKDMADMHNEIYAVGYTFESGLDNQPYDLRPIGTKGKSEMDEFRKGGSLDKENSDMVLNNNKQISHHTKELANAVNKNKNIPAWVVAKINRSATDISDATHYLEGAKYKKGGGVGDKITQKAKKEIDFLTKKGYNIDVYSTLNRDAIFGGEKIDEFIIATQGSLGSGKNIKFAIAYWYRDDEDGEMQLNTKLLNEISESFKNHSVILYTNAGVDLHSKTKGKYKNLEIHKIPYGEFSGNSDEFSNGGNLGFCYSIGGL